MKPLFSGEKLLKSVAACMFSAMSTAALLAILATAASWSGQFFNWIGMFLWVISYGFIIILIHLLVIAVPVQFILQKLKLTDYFTNLLAATVCVFGLFALYSQYDWFDDGEGFVPPRLEFHDLITPNYLKFYGFCAIVALVIATPAWFFRRPDLDQPKK